MLFRSPWHTLSQKEKDIILYGTGDEDIKINWNGYIYEKPYEGVIPNLERRLRESDSKQPEQNYQNISLKKHAQCVMARD